jgi:ribosomal protein S18 acetylase RimI-like enzyme
VNEPAVVVRKARQGDLDFLRAVAPRLVAFGSVPTRSAEAIVRTVRLQLVNALERMLAEQAPAASAADGSTGRGTVAVLIAEDGAGDAAGCVHVQLGTEFFSGEPEAYVAVLAVTEAAEGRGIGRALMAAAEHWAQERGLTRLSLEVFAGNRRAREFYAKQGFEEDSLRLVREW